MIGIECFRIYSVLCCNVLVLKQLLETQAQTAEPHAAAVGDAGGDPSAEDDPKKRFLILISTVMTWASTKPLDPVR